MREIPDIIQTARLHLKIARPEDARAVQEAIQVSITELRPWISWANNIPTLETLEGIGKRAQQWFENRETFLWRIYLQQTFIGEIDLHHWDWEVPKCEIGYWGRSDYYGQGYMTEAVQSVLRVAFEQLEVRRVEALCDSRNERSIRLAQRVGMVKEGVLRNYELDPYGELCDQVVLSMTSEDFRKVR